MQNDAPNPYRPPTVEPKKGDPAAWSHVVAAIVLACITLFILFMVTPPLMRTIQTLSISDWTVRSLRIVSSSLLVMSAVSFGFSILAGKRGDWLRVTFLLGLGAATFAAGRYLCLANNL